MGLKFEQRAKGTLSIKFKWQHIKSSVLVPFTVLNLRSTLYMLCFLGLSITKRELKE